MMSKFYVGDRVRSIARMSATEGGIGVIITVKPRRHYQYEVNFNPETLNEDSAGYAAGSGVVTSQDDGLEWWMNEDELEVVK